MSALLNQLPASLNLLLVDDHNLLLDGLSLVLGSLAPDLRIHKAQTAEEARQLVGKQDFDLILLDLRLPDGSGLDLLRRWQQEGRLTPVAILSATDASHEVQAAYAAGARGFISKNCGAEALRDAVSRVLLGEVLPGPAARSHGRLTQRQFDILLLLAEGLPNKLISRRLHISQDTVKFHLKVLFQELGVNNRTACVSAARQLGLL
ncbi:response regulator transcription factor [Pseudomonas sp. UL073]|uniref:Response regulator transcription factor n=1 Tax=Zestomonas insulae TaxID=2809017 RepID=A0ABS2IDK3_9GAMM|nr:response regulator transcription factor [Pseudomonas insulae]MBM7060374.1 response regulator transcription factor [Pseudomonas insulae]